jgi:hypothetical protein
MEGDVWHLPVSLRQAYRIGAHHVEAFAARLLPRSNRTRCQADMRAVRRYCSALRSGAVKLCTMVAPDEIGRLLSLSEATHVAPLTGCALRTAGGKCRRNSCVTMRQNLI